MTRRPLTGWMVFQFFVGIWLFISPYVLGFSGESYAATVNTMISGALVAIMGILIWAYDEKVCGLEQQPGKSSV